MQFFSKYEIQRTTIKAVLIAGGVAACLLLINACSQSSNSDTASTGGGSCTLDDNTTAISTSTNGCTLVTRDVSSCLASRQAQGLTGFWLKFSCRVTLTKNGSNVTLTSDGQPDHTSPYFATSDSCYAAGFPVGRSANPGTLTASSLSFTVPFNPTYTSGAPSTGGGPIGMALNGVAIFNNAALAPDNIYDEVATFDKCEGHPAGSRYHYHTEPTSITNDGSGFVGILRDGFPIYGLKEPDGVTTPTLNVASNSGHTGTTPDSSTSVYHYHVHNQTVGGDSANFLTADKYLGALGTCISGCN